jgi:uncharacterized membrane protein
MRSFLLFLHLSAVIIWLGGMFFAHFFLRPAAAEQLPPAQRLPLLAAILGSFFKTVTFAIVILLVSGFARMGMTGFAQAPLHWHLMSAIGLLMTTIFALIYLFHYPQLKSAVAAQAWEPAGAAMNRIRRLVWVNLCLGALTVAVATLGPLFAA